MWRERRRRGARDGGRAGSVGRSPRGWWIMFNRGRRPSDPYPVARSRFAGSLRYGGSLAALDRTSRNRLRAEALRQRPSRSLGGGGRSRGSLARSFALLSWTRLTRGASPPELGRLPENGTWRNRNPTFQRNKKEAFRGCVGRHAQVVSEFPSSAAVLKSEASKSVRKERAYSSRSRVRALHRPSSGAGHIRLVRM